MNNTKPICYMLIGVPGSGKSTWIAKQPFDWSTTVIASTDNFIDKEAERQNKTYSEVFKDAMPSAINAMVKVVKEAIKNDDNIIWDQTSTSVGSRAKKFRMLPERYIVIGVVFKTPDKDELQRRLDSRAGKNIPPEAMRRMISSYQEPTEAEGFDKIIYVG